MRLAITSGEPAGIGPDIILQAHSRQALNDSIVIGDATLLAERARQLQLEISINSNSALRLLAPRPGSLNILHVPLHYPAQAGVLDQRNAHYVLNCINRAVDGCLQHDFDAMITAPVHKGIINEAGILFTGHTEYIAQRTRAFPVMMLAVKNKRVALVTTHLPLAQVSDAITSDMLARVIQTVHLSLQNDFGITRPRMYVCGLNPHAGEQGHLGREEIEIIIPTLDKLRQEQIDITGPVPADTLFTGDCFDRMDVAVAMYHDQGLPVIKHIGFGNVVNITLGLPIVRTSVDHGTALNLAGSGAASHESLTAALEYARDLAQNRTS